MLHMYHMYIALEKTYAFNITVYNSFNKNSLSMAKKELYCMSQMTLGL